MVSLAHPCLPAEERGVLAIDYLIQGMNNYNLQTHLLTANTQMLVSKVLAIEEYMAIGGAYWPSCKATGKEALFPSWKDNGYSEVLVATITNWEAIDIASKGAPTVPPYQEVVQPEHTLGQPHEKEKLRWWNGQYLRSTSKDIHVTGRTNIIFWIGGAIQKSSMM